MNKVILVVDDDVEITVIVEGILKQHNYEVLVAHDGPHAVEQSHKHRLDLILMDVRMPYFSGIWFCDAFKQKSQTRNIPIIIMSSLSSEEDIQKAYQAGAVGYLKKPFQVEELLDAVKKAIVI